MALRVLVTGANGQLGRELVEQGRGRGMAVIGLTRTGLDIADEAAVRRAVEEVDGDLVINAAAYTAVDAAESEPERAFASNADGPRHLARACAGRGLPLVHVSTDYVFDGRKATGYVEDDPVDPINVYGASKEAGERAVREELPAHVILRTSWVYGPHGRNFVRTMLELAARQRQLRVVADQHGCPTAAGDLAEAALTVAERLHSGSGPRGTFHLAGGGSTSWHGFAQAVMELCLPPGAPVPEVLPIPTSEFPRPARRPAHSILDCGRIGRLYGIEPRPWREALAEVGRQVQAAR